MNRHVVILQFNVTISRLNSKKMTLSALHFFKYPVLFSFIEFEWLQMVISHAVCYGHHWIKSDFRH